MTSPAPQGFLINLSVNRGFALLFCPVCERNVALDFAGSADQVVELVSTHINKDEAHHIAWRAHVAQDDRFAGQPPFDPAILRTLTEDAVAERTTAQQDIAQSYAQQDG